MNSIPQSKQKILSKKMDHLILQTKHTQMFWILLSKSRAQNIALLSSVGARNYDCVIKLSLLLHLLIIHYIICNINSCLYSCCFVN
jgi:hypothetical protein